MNWRIHKAAWLLTIAFVAPFLFFGGLAQAQPTEMPEMSGRGMGGMCPMMHMGSGWMTVGMILTGLLTLAAISALVALTIFLVRRSGPRTPSAA